MSDLWLKCPECDRSVWHCPTQGCRTCEAATCVACGEAHRTPINRAGQCAKCGPPDPRVPDPAALRQAQYALDYHRLRDAERMEPE